MPEPFDPSSLKRLASSLRRLRRKSGISQNQRAKVVGVSRRTLERIEKRNSKSETRRGTSHGSAVAGRGTRGHADPSTPLGMTRRWGRATGMSARTAYRLAKALLGEEETERRLEEQTRLSRFLVPDPLYKLLDDLYHYPAFLFHDSPQQRALRAEFGDDYGHTLDLLLRSRFATPNFGARLRAFPMQHHLTLIETAALL